MLFLDIGFDFGIGSFVLWLIAALCVNWHIDKDFRCICFEG